MPDHILLLHGLWMRSFTLNALKRRLERAGFTVGLFDYASVSGGPELAVVRLIAEARAVEAGRLHLVGHSLGGLVALQALRQAPDLPPGNVVCLGSPLKGSTVARGLARWPGGAALLGKSAQLLHEGLAQWDGSRPVGVVAGRLPVGLGIVVGALKPPHDGTVSVAETQLPGLTDHCTVPATHTGLLFSAEAAEQAIAFLRSGRFRKA